QLQCNPAFVRSAGTKVAINCELSIDGTRHPLSANGQVERVPGIGAMLRKRDRGENTPEGSGTPRRRTLIDVGRSDLVKNLDLVDLQSGTRRTGKPHQDPTVGHRLDLVLHEQLKV